LPDFTTLARILIFSKPAVIITVEQTKEQRTRYEKQKEKQSAEVS
jgi:hypothetical protein